MGAMQNLIVLFVGILAMNAALAALQWRRERTRLSRNLFFVWTSGLLCTFTQGLAVGEAFVTTLGFAFSIALTLALAYLLTGLRGGRVPWKTSLVLLAVGLGSSLALATWDAPFWAVALPTALAVAFPVVLVGGRLLLTRWGSLSATGKVLAAACVAYGLHSIDFAFLRSSPELVPTAFVVGLFIVIALSVTAPVVVLERVAEARSKAEQSRARAEETKRIQSDFFANVSHELRTPLTLILSPVEVILHEHSDDLSPTVTRYLASIKRNAARLLKLINNLLELAKLGAGKVFLRYEALELYGFLSDLLPPFAALGKRKGVAVKLEGKGVEPVHLDVERTEIIFLNLLSNALKFTEQGEVTVRVSQEASRVLVEIRDTGVGIPARDLRRVFERFAQSDSSATRLFGGTGIGLALVDELVRLQGGAISVESHPGQGSVFSVWFPKGTAHIREDLRDRRRVDLPVVYERRSEGMDPAAAISGEHPVARVGQDPTPEVAQDTEEILAPRQAPPGSPLLLVVEDNSDLRRFLGSLLAPHFRVTFARDGQEGVAVARERRPDLILSDVMMPRLSGYGLVRRIKGDPSTREIPVVLLTAKRGLEPRLEGFEHGADDYLGKPFSARELLARIRVQLRLRDLGRRLSEVKKTRMLATLAAGLAHEVRNPVNAIVNAVPPLRRLGAAPAGKAEEEAVLELLDVIEQAGIRINDMVEDLLSFTNLDRAEVRTWDPHASMESTLRLLGAARKIGSVERDFQFEGVIEGRSGALNTVVMNLLDNAMRAAGERGVVTLATRSAGQGLCMEISDDGPGIPPETLPRIFDPYFTTRDVGDGLGLGLHLCRTIVEGHGGRLSARSEPGQGATFTVELPREPHLSQEVAEDGTSYLRQSEKR